MLQRQPKKSENWRFVNGVVCVCVYVYMYVFMWGGGDFFFTTNKQDFQILYRLPLGKRAFFFNFFNAKLSKKICIIVSFIII